MSFEFAFCFSFSSFVSEFCPLFFPCCSWMLSTCWPIHDTWCGGVHFATTQTDCLPYSLKCCVAHVTTTTCTHPLIELLAPKIMFFYLFSEMHTLCLAIHPIGSNSSTILKSPALPKLSIGLSCCLVNGTGFALPFDTTWLSVLLADSLRSYSILWWPSLDCIIICTPDH